MNESLQVEVITAEEMAKYKMHKIGFNRAAWVNFYPSNGQYYVNIREVCRDPMTRKLTGSKKKGINLNMAGWELLLNAIIPLNDEIDQLLADDGEANRNPPGKTAKSVKRKKADDDSKKSNKRKSTTNPINQNPPSYEAGLQYYTPSIEVQPSQNPDGYPVPIVDDYSGIINELYNDE